ncbi:MAG: hypothetical protein CM15mP129_11350 [Chloroflexota bacterium]|nr:MAG: hypothetical protein CM15mP129_11350 [Chloroflexota bacterium]
MIFLWETRRKKIKYIIDVLGSGMVGDQILKKWLKKGRNLRGKGKFPF